MSIMVVVEDQGVLNHRFAKKLSSEQIHCPTLRITIVTSIPLPQYVTIEKDKWFERLRDANRLISINLPTVMCYKNGGIRNANPSDLIC